MRRSNEDLKQFAYVAAHDLREPLRSISGFIQLLERREGSTMSSEGREFVQLAIRGVRQMEDTLNGLLTYSLIDGTEPEGEPIDVNALVGEVQLNLNSRINSTGTIIRSADLPAIKGDKLQIKRVFQNLIENAIKFRSEAAPEIEIDATPVENGFIQFSIADNGIGIEPTHRERVFTIFERLHTREEFEGSGIGLAICKRVVERHGGRIFIDPQSENGLKICFRLPSLHAAGKDFDSDVHTTPIEVPPEKMTSEPVGRIDFVEPLQVASSPELAVEGANEIESPQGVSEEQESHGFLKSKSISKSHQRQMRAIKKKKHTAKPKRRKGKFPR
ncbi:MAG: ATP-binding protein [Verrucomicrobiota bacterium]